MPICCVYVDTSENRVVFRQCTEDDSCPPSERPDIEVYSFTVSGCEECPPYPTQRAGQQETGGGSAEAVSPKEELVNLRRRFEQLFEGEEEQDEESRPGG